MAIRYGLGVRTAGTATGGPGFTPMATAACVAPGTGSRHCADSELLPRYRGDGS